MSYSSAHETSDLRTYACKGGARGPGGRVALLRCLRPQALPDPSRQCPPRASASDRRKSRVRLPDGAQRHPCLRREGPRRPPSGLLASQRSPRRLRREGVGGFTPDAPRQMLHHNPRNYGKQSSLWTLRMAAEVSFEEGITQGPVSGETIRATLARLGVRWERAKRWMESPDPQYARKKGSRSADQARPEPPRVGFGLRGRELVLPLRAAFFAFVDRCREAPYAPPPERTHEGRSRAEGPLLLRAVPAGARRDLAEVRGRPAD